MKKTFRVCLLIGLILSTATFAYMLISSILAMIAASAVITGADSLGEAFTAPALVITIGVMAIMAIFALLGLIFSAINFSRVSMSPEKFAEKKGKLVATIVFDFLLLAFTLFGLFQSAEEGIDALVILCIVAMIASPVLIIIDMKRNKKLLEKHSAQTEEQPAKQEAAETPAQTEQENSEPANPKQESDEAK